MRLIDADAIEYKELIIDTTYRSTDGVLVWQEKRKNEWVSKEAIDKMPTIETKPVRHGRWEFIGGYGYQYRCSKCIMCADYRTNYCPNCGAKMDEVEE